MGTGVGALGGRWEGVGRALGGRWDLGGRWRVVRVGAGSPIDMDVFFR